MIQSMIFTSQSSPVKSSPDSFPSPVAIAGYLINYAVETRTGTSSATGAIYLAVAQGCFAIGRFSGSFLMQYIKARPKSLQLTAPPLS
ncbi:MAG: hypothetical protein Q9183_004898 [Haloplaca sp. 2 TL-2023]